MAREILVVVVARSNQVTQKVVDAGEPLRPDDLAQAARYLNTEFAGLRCCRCARQCRSGCVRSGRCTTSCSRER